MGNTQLDALKDPGPPPTVTTFHPADRREDHQESRGQPARGGRREGISRRGASGGSLEGRGGLGGRREERGPELGGHRKGRA